MKRHVAKRVDRTLGLDEVPEAYRAMNERRAIKALIAL